MVTFLGLFQTLGSTEAKEEALDIIIILLFGKLFAYLILSLFNNPVETQRQLHSGLDFNPAKWKQLSSTGQTEMHLHV